MECICRKGATNPWCPRHGKSVPDVQGRDVAVCPPPVEPCCSEDEKEACCGAC
jgi:hypothetical protein